MPKINDLLPAARLNAIRNHASKPEFAQKVKTAIADLRSFVKHPGVNQDVPSAIWVSYGKDSQAMWLLCELAEIEYEPCFIYNELELPQHYAVVPEFNNWINIIQATTYNTHYRGIEYLQHSLETVRGEREKKNVTNKPPVTFFEPQEGYALFYYQVIGSFHHEHYQGRPNTLNMWSSRACEGMGRQWEFSKNGKLFQPAFSLEPKEIPLWRGLPIADWQDMDVWAWLLTWDCPVSPVYGMNAVSQRGVGRNYYPRTLWYCDPHIFNVTFCKWLKKYAPGCLSEIMQYFPEVREKLTKGNSDISQRFT